MNLKNVSKIISSLQKHHQLFVLSGHASMSYSAANSKKMDKELDDYSHCNWPYKTIVFDFIDNKTLTSGFITMMLNMAKHVVKKNGQTLIFRKPKSLTVEQKEVFHSFATLIKKEDTTSVQIQDYIPQPEEQRKELEIKCKLGEMRRSYITTWGLLLLGVSVGIFGDFLGKFELQSGMLKGVKTNTTVFMGLSMLAMGLLRGSWQIIKKIIFRKK